MKPRFLFTCLLFASIAVVSNPSSAGEPPEVFLWEDSSPPTDNGLAEGAEQPTKAGMRDVRVPTLTVHLPASEEPTAAVLILPGGGYGSVCVHTEGTPPAEWLMERGVAGFVLKYRMPNGRSAVPLEDAGRALEMIREEAARWNIDPGRIGVWGFSAGGHLASMVATRLNVDFAILYYPVISMEEGVSHGGSRRNLLGQTPSGDQVASFSSDRLVTEETPPVFLLHAFDDLAVPIENSFRFSRALLEAGVLCEVHFYEAGGHGPVAYQRNPSSGSALERWLARRGVTAAGS